MKIFREILSVLKDIRSELAKFNAPSKPVTENDTVKEEKSNTDNDSKESKKTYPHYVCDTTILTRAGYKCFTGIKGEYSNIIVHSCKKTGVDFFRSSGTNKHYYINSNDAQKVVDYIKKTFC